MRTSPQSMLRPEPATEDLVEQSALDIARRNRLEGTSLKKLSQEFNMGVTTLHRKLARWIKQDRFELIDRWSSPTLDVPTDEPLGESLAQETSIRRARVADVTGVEAAYGPDYRQSADSYRGQAAYEAGDKLHLALADVAARLLLNKMRPNMAIGLASGRGVAFTVQRLEELTKDRPSWISGYQGVEIFSLSGGSWMGSWWISFNRPLDADANVFHLGTILQVPPSNRTYKGSWLVRDALPGQPSYEDVHLDLVIAGIGQLDTGHHFLRPDAALQLESMSDALTRIKEFQEIDQHRAVIAEICHILFHGGTGQPPEEVAEIMARLNSSISTAPKKILQDADEVLLVAGGAQKEEALYNFVKGHCTDAPIDPGRVTLITDAWTARRILERG